MALPTSMAVSRDPLKKTGIVLGVYPSSDPLCDVELWRSTQIASTSSSLWTVTRYPPSTTPAYTLPVPLPASTRYNYLKARSQKIGHSPSAFTATVRAKPLIFAQYPASPPPLINNGGDAEIPATIIVPSSNAMNVGAPSQVSPTTYVTKYMYVPCQEFLNALSTAVPVSYGMFSVRPSGSTLARQLYAPLSPPPGVTLDQVSIRTFKGSASTVNVATITINKTSDGNTVNGVITVTRNATTGWVTSDSTAFTDSVTTAFQYGVSLVLRHTGVLQCQFSWLRIRYRMPNYAKTI